MYAKIIDDLIEQAAVSFEEDGVNHSVLDELKKVWSFRSFLSPTVIHCFAILTLSVLQY